MFNRDIEERNRNYNSEDMKVLIVCSYKPHMPEGCVPFIREQVEALRAQGCECEYYHIKDNGKVHLVEGVPVFTLGDVFEVLDRQEENHITDNDAQFHKDEQNGGKTASRAS